MRSITYYVATSLDGYICGPDEDISGFVHKGSGVAEYLTDLKEFDTVIMGRKTYEFGYQYGLDPVSRPTLTWSISSFLIHWYWKMPIS
ncbi:MAG: hypothetical protein RIF33_18045 [Cyclobacteriaceae bacterium]